MNPLRIGVAAAALALAGVLCAQTGERGSTPPGESRDGTAPAEGAIKGGAILPGETSGIPDKRERDSRCEELSGSLREDCLKREREAAQGSTKPIDTRRRAPERAD